MGAEDLEKPNAFFFLVCVFFLCFFWGGRGEMRGFLKVWEGFEKEFVQVCFLKVELCTN